MRRAMPNCLAKDKQRVREVVAVATAYQRLGPKPWSKCGLIIPTFGTHARQAVLLEAVFDSRESLANLQKLGKQLEYSTPSQSRL